jgi:hypothetical protein
MGVKMRTYKNISYNNPHRPIVNKLDLYCIYCYHDSYYGFDDFKTTKDFFIDREIKTDLFNLSSSRNPPPLGGG